MSSKFIKFVVQAQDKFSQTLGNLDKKMEGITKKSGKLAKLNAKLQRDKGGGLLGGMMGGGIGQLAGLTGIGFAMGNIINVFKDTQTAYSRLMSVMNVGGKGIHKNSKEFIDLRNVVEDVSRTSIFTSTEVASMGEEFLKAGGDINALTKNMGALTDGAAAFNGIMGAGDFIGLATDIGTVFHGTEKMGKKLTGTIDSMVYAANNASMSIGQYGEAMKKFSPVAKEFGYDMDETSAMIMALADTGVKGELAGTHMKIIQTRLFDPDKSLPYLDSLGIKAYDMKDGKKVKRNMMKIMSDLAKYRKKALEELEKKGTVGGKSFGSPEETKIQFDQEWDAMMISMGGRDALSTMMSLTNPDLIAKYEANKRKLKGEMSRTLELDNKNKEQFAKDIAMYRDIKEKYKAFVDVNVDEKTGKVDIKGKMSKKQYLDSLKKDKAKIDSILDFDEKQKAIQELHEKIGALSGTYGATGKAMDTNIKMNNNLGGGLKKLESAWEGLLKSMGGGSSILEKLVHYLTLAITGTSGKGGLIGLVNEFRPIFVQMMSDLKPIMMEVAKYMKSIGGYMLGIMREYPGIIKYGAMFVGGLLGLRVVIKLFKAMRRGVVGATMGLAQGIGTTVKTTRTLASGVKRGGMGIARGGKEVATGVKGISNIFKGIFSKGSGKIFGILKFGFKKIFNFKRIFGFVLKMGLRAIPFIGWGLLIYDVLDIIASAFFDGWGNMWSKFNVYVGELWGEFKDWIGGLWNELGIWVSDKWASAGDIFSGIGGKIWEGLKVAWTFVIDNLKELLEPVTKWVEEWVMPIINWIGELLDKIALIGGGVFQSALSTLGIGGGNKEETTQKNEDINLNVKGVMNDSKGNQVGYIPNQSWQAILSKRN